MPGDATSALTEESPRLPLPGTACCTGKTALMSWYQLFTKRLVPVLPTELAVGNLSHLSQTYDFVYTFSALACRTGAHILHANTYGNSDMCAVLLEPGHLQCLVEVRLLQFLKGVLELALNDKNSLDLLLKVPDESLIHLTTLQLPKTSHWSGIIPTANQPVCP